MSALVLLPINAVSLDREIIKSAIDQIALAYPESLCHTEGLIAAVIDEIYRQSAAVFIAKIEEEDDLRRKHDFEVELADLVAESNYDAGLVKVQPTNSSPLVQKLLDNLLEVL